MTQTRFNVRIQDILIALMFGALVVLAHNALERSLLAAMAALQMIEGRAAWLGTLWGRTTSVLLQLLICYVLLGWTYTLSSEYYPVLLLPVVSTATYLGLSGTVAISFAAIAAYLSFLLPWFIDWKQFAIDADAIHTLEVRCVL